MISAELLWAARVAADALGRYADMEDAEQLGTYSSAGAILRRHFLEGCPGCGQPLDPHGRADRRYCSPACRVRAYRARCPNPPTAHSAVTAATHTPVGRWHRSFMSGATEG